MITLIFILSILIFITLLVAELACPVFLIFLTLKLVGVITWSWFWVCFPLILGLVCICLWGALKVWANMYD